MRSRLALAFACVFALASAAAADEAEVDAVARRRPDDPSVLYQLAAVQANARRFDEALATLARMDGTGAGLVPRRRDFGPLADDARFRTLVDGIRAAHPPVVRSRVAFELAEADLAPEGIAYSAKAGSFYLGSLKRKIIAVSSAGVARELVAPGSGGLGAAVGIRVDDERGELWAVSEIVSGPLPGAIVGVFCFRLADGGLVRTVPVRQDQGAMLNDLVVAHDGTVYVTASGNGALLRIAPGASAAEVFLPAKSLPDPNGITLDESGRHPVLYIAGWYGITRVDLTTRDQKILDKPAGVADGCIDGLYLKGRDLVGVQNCNHDPGRILRLHLARDGKRIERAEVLEASNPLFDGVTTAAIVGNDLFWVGNAQLRKTSGQTPLEILRLGLPR